ncbi:Glycoside hydrolase/deacetylase [Trichophyton interdigitale]|uniref:Glycoside hydrolase/deacetylase n=1 Tax=Trichophyton interdigitale TaxID=101480 RepID=A0A9P4YJM9_9EURO|nr:Glycoside hydrolase/deacetylase [Trichophyton interdigitale]KAF3900064.1 Glycoside hydrolase/deacetylase [Trichophyton interdigitale]
MHYLRYLIPFALFAVVNGDKNNDGQPARLRMPPVLRPPFPLGPMPRPFPSPGGFSTSNNAEPDDQGAPLAACGPYAGSCPEGLCCSSSGYCGKGPMYCAAPDCMLEYSSGCDAHKKPSGEDTSDVPRDKVGDVPYGEAAIYDCTVPNTIALTYDDGPYIYTRDLLDILDSFNVKATFFITGINSNKGAIDDPNYPWADLIRRMYNSGHQIASHTWSHQNLDQISASQRKQQMIRNEMAFRNIMGGFPTYMRPPYSSCSVASGCLGDMGDLGYHVTYFNLDTDDYNNDSPELIQRSKDIFDSYITQDGRPLLEIGHDVHEQTVYNLTGHMLRRLEGSGYRTVTVGECLGDPPANWYRWTSAPDDQSRGDKPPKGGKKFKPVKPPSPDGTCGTSYTCTGSGFGRCCSASGFCGNRALHCGKGCQKIGGVCSEDPSDSNKHTQFGKGNKKGSKKNIDHSPTHNISKEAENDEDKLGKTEDNKKAKEGNGRKDQNEDTTEHDDDQNTSREHHPGNEKDREE